MDLGRISQLVHVSIHQKAVISVFGMKKVAGQRATIRQIAYEYNRLLSQLSVSARIIRAECRPQFSIPASIIEILVNAS